MSKTVTIDAATLAAMIAEGVAAALKEQKLDRQDAAKAANADKYVRIDAAIAKAFQKKGYKKIVLFDRTKLLAQQPDVTVLTYNKWLELGRKVKPGETSVKYKQFRLFHKDQTEIMSPEVRKAEFAKMQEAIARYQAKKNGTTAGTEAVNT